MMRLSSSFMCGKVFHRNKDDVLGTIRPQRPPIPICLCFICYWPIYKVKLKSELQFNMIHFDRAKLHIQPTCISKKYLPLVKLPKLAYELTSRLSLSRCRCLSFAFQRDITTVRLKEYEYFNHWTHSLTRADIGTCLNKLLEGLTKGEK